jgi:hypothetical protein
MTISHARLRREGRNAWRRPGFDVLARSGHPVFFLSPPASLPSTDGYLLLCLVSRSHLPVSFIDYEYTWWAEGQSANTMASVFRVARMAVCLFGGGGGGCGPIKSRMRRTKVGAALDFSGDRFLPVSVFVSSPSWELGCTTCRQKLGRLMTSSCRWRLSPGCCWERRSVTPTP